MYQHDREKIEYYCVQFFSKTMHQRIYGDITYPILDLSMVPYDISEVVMKGTLQLSFFKRLLGRPRKNRR